MRESFRKAMKDGWPVALLIVPLAIWANWQAIGNPAGFIVTDWNPARMECTELAGPEVTRACYLSAEKIAVVTFNGADLAYCGIDDGTFAGLLSSAAPDDYFGSSIRDDAVGERFHCGGIRFQHHIS